MKIARLGLGSLKGFDEMQYVSTRGLGLVFGGNSSGKSSVIQALMLMKQSSTLARGIDTRPLEFRGSIVDLGGFRTLVHDHDPERTISMHLSLYQITGNRSLFGRSLDLQLGFGLAGNDDTEPVLSKVSIIGSADQAEVQFKYNGSSRALRLANNESALVVVDKLVAHLNETTTARPGDGTDFNEDDFAWLRQWIRKQDLRTAGWIPMWWPGDIVEGRPGRPLGGSKDSPRSELVQLFVYTWYNFANDLNYQLRSVLDRVNYVAPLREFPRRVVTEAGSGAGLGIRGERLVLHLGRNPNLVKRVNAAFKQLDLRYSLTVKQLNAPETQDALGDVAVAVLTDNITGVSLSPADVGFGVSQVLPVIVQLVGSTNTLIVIEQPEIHLHPRMQARLADVIIDSVMTNRNQVLIETHSEHILSRVQRRIREGSFSPTAFNPFNVYYVSSQEGRSRIESMRVDRSGRMNDPWPDDFMDERLDDLFASI